MKATVAVACAAWRRRTERNATSAQIFSRAARTVLEEGVLIFNPGHVRTGEDVYIGHRTMLKGDTRGELVIEDGAWIGQDCYLDSATATSELARSCCPVPRLLAACRYAQA